MIPRSGLNLTRLKAVTLAVMPQLLDRWLPSGEKRAHVYVALNPRRDDRNLGSFQIDLRNGKWRDHAIGIGGNDLISLFAYLFTVDDYGKAIKLIEADPLVRAAIAPV